jgi:serine/threonine protein kinase
MQIREYHHCVVLSREATHSFPTMSYAVLRTALTRETSSVLAGSFGSVYKAILHDGTPVAIKVLDLNKMGAPKGWAAECETLRNVRHRNLIRLVTICASVDFAGNDFRALVYELMSNGSLEEWIHQRAGLTAEDALNISH